MGDLYTVRFARKQVITRYSDGKKPKIIETKEVMIQQTYHDLPLSTAMGYRDVVEGEVTIELQAQRTERWEPGQARHRERPEVIHLGDESKPRAKKAPVEALPQKLGGGDYSDVINSMRDG